VISPTEMASTKEKEKMLKVARSLLVQILKIWLNTQSHKTLNERKKFFFYSLKKVQRDRWPK
jgi:hypothetical protein